MTSAIRKYLTQVYVVPASVIVLVVVVLVVLNVWPASRAEPVTVKASLVEVMGTDCELTVVVRKDRPELAARAFGAAEAALRKVEAHMSARLAASELAKLNAAPAGQRVDLSAETLDLLRLSRKLAERTGGAFDVTCRPIVQAWAEAGRGGRLPTEDELRKARRTTGWGNIELLATGARKLSDSASVDLGGIAKGYGVDRAIQVIIDSGALGALVNLGGDIRCFNHLPDGEGWTVGVQSPFTETLIATLQLSEGAVCTSGNYRRFVEIDHKRYSHIVDPRTGWPADMVPSVTVVAPTATIADAWATALSVLGLEGLELLPPDNSINTMIVVGTAEEYEIYVTPGFEELFLQRPQAGTKVYRRAAAMAAEAKEN